jgi:uncharacterized protein YecT (DUF1311 family)
MPPTKHHTLLAATAIALLALNSPGRAADKDPIDAKLDACLAEATGQTTAGMVECTGTAVDAWEKRLNETYQKALAALDPTSRDLLRTAQQQWLAFRAAEHAAQAGPWQADRGSLARVEVMGADLSAIKERVEELRDYLPGD